MNQITKTRRPRIKRITGQVVASTTTQTFLLIKTALSNGNKLVQFYRPLSYRKVGRNVVSLQPLNV